jgi:hypothetical protein
MQGVGSHLGRLAQMEVREVRDAVGRHQDFDSLGFPLEKKKIILMASPRASLSNSHFGIRTPAQV